MIRAAIPLTLALALISAGGGCDEVPPSEALDLLQTRVESASRSFDIPQAEEALALARRVAQAQSSARAIELEVRAGLLVAELERLAFENLPKDQRQTRSEIGERIDAAAEAALARVELLPESSERWRLRADLLATLIRSDYRAKKHHRAFEEAVDRAMLLDGENPHVWVTSAKPLIFAGPKRGQDLDEAVRVLDRALEIAPGLESALLLRALAEERRGEEQRAAADWRAALDRNPLCVPAREAIERFAGESPP